VALGADVRQRDDPSAYETVMALVGFAILWSAKSHHFRAGWLFALYLSVAGVEWLLIERIRPNAFFLCIRRQRYPGAIGLRCRGRKAKDGA